VTASIFGAMSASHDLQRQLKRLELCLPRPAKTPPAGLVWIPRNNTEWRRFIKSGGDDLPPPPIALEGSLDGHYLPTSLTGHPFIRDAFAGRDLRGIDLQNADLNFPLVNRYDAANLTNAVLREANLFHNSFKNAILDGADLSEAYLVRTSFAGAKLRGANLFGADLRGADLNYADLLTALACAVPDASALASCTR